MTLELRYLSEPDLIKVGALDMKWCIEVMKEMFGLLAQGDYRMGGPNHNSHGIKVSFPEHPEFDGMPAHTSDRRYMAMPAYLGGKYRMIGLKWYGSNIANLERGMPRSMHIVVLNDVDSGAPIAVMSGNLISAVRTGAVAGLGAAYLSAPDATDVAVIGPGLINRIAFEGVMAARPGIRRVRIAARSKQSKNALSFKTLVQSKYPDIDEVTIVDSTEAAVRGAHIVALAATGLAGSAHYPYFREDWLMPGAYIGAASNCRFDEDFLLGSARNIVDHTPLYEAYVRDLNRPYHEKIGMLGVKYEDLYAEGKLSHSQVTQFGDIVRGKAPAREAADQVALFSIGGIPVQDVAWSTELLWRAREEGVGTVLPIWDAPHLV